MPVKGQRVAEAVRGGAIARRPRAVRPSSPALLLCVLALLVQSLFVQTHVHLPWLEQADEPSFAAAATPAAHSRTHHGAPAHGDADHCPLWQAALHAGAFTTPVLDLPAYLPVMWRVIAPLLPAAVARPVLCHSWQGRAPPRL